MRKVTIGILFFIGGIVGSLHAQTTSEGAFGGTGEDSIVSVSPTVDGEGYVIFGASNSFSSSTEAFLARTDNAGNYSWARTLSNTNTNIEPVAAIEAHGSTEADQSYIVFYHFNSSNLLNIVKYNYNSDSNLDSAYYNIDLNYMEVHSIVRTDNGYIIVISSTNGRSVVLSFDDDLNLLANIGEQHTAAHITDVIVDDSRIFIAGTATDNQYVYMLEVDEYLSTTGIGEKIFTVSFDLGGTLRADEVQIARNSAGEFLIATNSSSNPTIGKVLIKTDSDGDNAVAYEYGIEEENDFYITDVASTDAGFIMTGYTNSSYVNSQGEEDVLFVNVSDAVALKKASIFGKDKSDKGQFIYANSDESVTIFAKSRSFSNSGDVDMYVIKTDASSTSLCNETVINFALEQETVSDGSGQTLFNWAYTPGSSSSGTVFVTSDATLTSLCACEQELSFATSGAACEGEAVMFTDLGSSLNYVWDFGDGVTDSTSVDGTIYITYDSPGIRYVSVNVANNSCYTSGTQAVVIYPVPDITITAPTSACTGETVDFESDVTPEDGGPWQYNWDLGEEADPDLATSENVYGVVYSGNSKEVTVSLTVFDEHCSAIQTHTIAITESPDADFEAISPVCTGEDVQFINKSLNAASYEWDFDITASEGSSTDTDPTYTYTSAGDKAVQLVATSGSCTDTALVSIVVHETPEITFTTSGAAANAYCTGSLVDFDATVTSTMGQAWEYEWNFGSGNAEKYATVEDPQGIEFNVAGDIEVSLTVKDDYCSATYTDVVAISQTPDAAFSTNEPQCTGETVEFINTGTSGASYSWNFGTGNAADVSTDENPTFVYDTVDGDGEKLIELITTLGSCSDTAKQAITIYATPRISFSSDVATQNCAGDLVSFISTVLPGTAAIDWSYSWDFGAGAKPSASTAENPVDIYYGYGGTKEVSLQVQSDYCTNFKTITIHVDSLPIPDVIEDDTVCADRCLTIGGDSIAGASYLWYPSTTLNSSTLANPEACPVAAYTTYYVSVTDENGCTGIDTINITMLQSADVNAGIDGEICRNESFQLGAALIEGQTYSWYPTEGLDDSTISNPVATPDSTTTYTVSVQYKGCDIVTDEVEVLVHQLPEVDAFIEDHLDSITIANGESVQLYAIGAMQYIWSPWNGLDNEGIFNPVASPDETTIYAVTGTDIYGCANSDTVYVLVVEPSTWVPNAFTPNDDDLNDVFYVRAKEAEEFEIYIYSRNGQVVFHATTTEQGWDGTNISTGEEMPQGAYVYHMRGTLSDGEIINEKGIINLIR